MSDSNLSEELPKSRLLSTVQWRQRAAGRTSVGPIGISDAMVLAVGDTTISARAPLAASCDAEGGKRDTGFRAIVATWRLWRERRSARRALATIDARSLQELGIAPELVDYELRQPFWRPLREWRH